MLRAAMDLRFYFQLFWLPAVASAALLVLLWLRDDLSRRGQAFAVCCFLLAVAAQYLAPATSVAWAAGLAMQTVLAVCLLMKQQLANL